MLIPHLCSNYVQALRLIKYAVGKSGVEFRREMQRHSAAVNKAVRDTAHETIAAIFAGENDKPSPAEDLNKRIQVLEIQTTKCHQKKRNHFLAR